MLAFGQHIVAWSLVGQLCDRMALCGQRRFLVGLGIGGIGDSSWLGRSLAQSRTPTTPTTPNAHLPVLAFKSAQKASTFSFVIFLGGMSINRLSGITDLSPPMIAAKILIDW